MELWNDQEVADFDLFKHVNTADLCLETFALSGKLTVAT